jgi:putative colanic acid biosynthesis UDP-glucose lipid carrier transferase
MHINVNKPQRSADALTAAAAPRPDDGQSQMKGGSGQDITHQATGSKVMDMSIASWTTPKGSIKPPMPPLPQPTRPAQLPPVEPFVATRPADAMNALFAARPPLPISTFVANLSEPALSVGLLFLATVFQGQPVDRATMLLAMLVLLTTFPGKERFHSLPLDVVIGVTGAWAATLAILGAIGFATRSFHFFEPKVLIWWVALTPVSHIGAALLGASVMRLHAARTEARRPALVIGAGTLGLKVATMLERRSAYGHDFYGYLEDRAPERCPPEVRSRLLGRLEDLPRLIQRAGIRDIYVTLPLGQQPRIMRLMAQLQDSAASVYYVPDVFGVNIIQGRMHNMDGVPVVGLLESPFVGVNGLLKRASDIVLACLILLLIAPVLLLVALGVKRSSPGPIIFKQRRHGLDGEEIIVYKFRSMTTMDNGATVQQATKHDPRITPFGAFIRRTSLDELPQFINVLQGRMSIVGPRPHAVAHNQQYRQLIKSYMVRHKVRPGITGWAQVNGHRGETDTIEKMARRIECDLEYLRNWSLGLDLKIIARTAGMTWFDKKAY